MAARALVDIFNGLDNATERRGVQTSLQLSPHPSASTPLVLSKARQSLTFSSVEIVLTGIDGTRPQSCGETPKPPKLNQEAPGNNGSEFRLKFLAFVVRLSS